MGLPAKLVRAQLHIMKPIAANLSLEATRKGQDKLGEIMEAIHRRDVFEREHDFGAFQGAWLMPKDERRQGVILYLHGGGYTCGSLEYAKGFAATLADECGVRVFCAAYRLAPEHRYPAALDDALRFEGYATRVAYNGLEAVRMLAEQSIDIVLLDRDLPIMSGDAVMETIASNDIPVSVLMLTAAAQVRDRINGLELGADDYLIKPFAYPELLARIRALQRRTGKGDFSGTEFSHNGIVLDTVRHTVTRDGKPVNLSPKEYGVLLEIMKADGSYVNAEELFDTVWAGASATDLTDAIKTTVYSLRRKLGEGNGITSTRGKGYRLS